MLITFSGIVGGGKSTNAKRTLHFLQENGSDAVYLRFRFLSWKWILCRPPARKKHDSNRKTSEKASPAKPNPPPRTGSVRPLTVLPFFGYLWRMLNFRLFLKFRMKNKIGICDRYFFDNLVHYRLTDALERFYLRLLKKAMPRPDLCFMFTASRETIIERRQHYEPGYLRLLWEQYEGVVSEFPHLVHVNSDRFDHIDDLIRRRVSEVSGQNRQQSATQSSALANTSDFEGS